VPAAAPHPVWMNEVPTAEAMLAVVSPLAEYFLLAVASIFWPLLIAIVVIVLRTDHPVKLLSAFLAGGLLATITVGIALVSTFDGTSALSRNRGTADPAVSIAVGVLAVIGALALRRLDMSRLRDPKPKATPAKPTRTERLVENARLAFLAGLVLNIVPGLFPIVALKNVAEGGYPAAVNVTLVVVFYLIMFTSVEIPIVGYMVAPQPTVATVQRLNDWLDRNARKVATLVLGVAGLYLVVRGLVAL